MHEKRTGYVNRLTKDNWFWKKLYEAARSVQNGRKISDYVEQAACLRPFYPLPGGSILAYA